jgi:hypothetical protein
VGYLLPTHFSNTIFKSSLDILHSISQVTKYTQIALTFAGNSNLKSGEKKVIFDRKTPVNLCHLLPSSALSGGRIRYRTVLLIWGILLPVKILNIRYTNSTLMKNVLLFCLILIAGVASAATFPDHPYGFVLGKAELKSAGAMALGPNGVLFVADPKGAAIFAFDIKDMQADTATTRIEVKNIDKVLASFLGIAAEDVVINDMLAHPTSQQIYLSVSRGRSADALPVLVRVNRQGQVDEIKMDNILFSKADIANAPGIDEKTSWGAPKRQMAVTDLQFFDGELYVAGLSNEEFASRLRRISFPFTSAQNNTSVEIFHTSHNRYETNAPIETMLPVKLNNQSSILAGYGCAPLAKFSVADLKGNKHVKGQTLAELGGGSRPLDMILIIKKGEEYVIVANSNRSIYTLKVSDLEKSQPLTTPVDATFVSSGTPFVSTAYVGVMQIDNLNKNFVAAIQRDIQTGALNLVSIPKRWL